MPEQKIYERRAFAADELRVDSEKHSIIGHAAVFNSMSEDLGWFREKIAPGAFNSAISRDDVRALVNHDSNMILGRNKAGTLRMKEDSRGLLVEIDPPDTGYARDLLVSIGRRDITQMSFGFQTIREEWDVADPKNPVRTLLEVRLFDVSPVVFPAYPETDVAARSLEAWGKLAAPRQERVSLIMRARAKHLRRMAELGI